MSIALLLAHPAHAACVIADPGEGTGEVNSDFVPAPPKPPGRVYVGVSEETADDFMQRFLYDLPSIWSANEYDSPRPLRPTIWASG